MGVERPENSAPREPSRAEVPIHIKGAVCLEQRGHLDSVVPSTAGVCGHLARKALSRVPMYFAVFPPKWRVDVLQKKHLFAQKTFFPLAAVEK